MGGNPGGQKISALHGWTPPHGTEGAPSQVGAHTGRKVPPSRVLGAHTGTGGATPHIWMPTRGTEVAAPRVDAHAWDRMWHSAQVDADTGINSYRPCVLDEGSAPFIPV